MLIIPVIDLSQGIVVRAICGKRKTYQPITSAISSNCKPETILSAFFKLYPFKIIYIADLDAIQGNGNQSKLINKFALKYKECEFWVDAGIHQILTRKSNKTNKNIGSKYFWNICVDVKINNISNIKIKLSLSSNEIKKSKHKPINEVKKKK